MQPLPISRQLELVSGPHRKFRRSPPVQSLSQDQCADNMAITHQGSTFGFREEVIHERELHEIESEVDEIEFPAKIGNAHGIDVPVDDGLQLDTTPVNRDAFGPSRVTVDLGVVRVDDWVHTGV